MGVALIKVDVEQQKCSAKWPRWVWKGCEEHTLWQQKFRCQKSENASKFKFFFSVNGKGVILR